MPSIKRLSLTASVAILALILTSAVHAGPPFFTDDPQPVEYQHWEFYVASIDTKAGGDWSGTAPHIEINYGVVPNVQLHLIAPLAYSSPSVGGSHYGVGDTELGVKFRFLQETNYLPQAGIFPLVEIPTGSASDGLGNGHWQVVVPVWLQKSWGSWTAYGGGGYVINSFHDNDNWGFVGGVLQKQVTHNILVGAEVYHETAPQGESSNTAFNIGTVIDLSDSHHLLFSAGRSIDGPVDFQCYIAYQFTFDNSLFHFWNHTHR